MMIEKTLKKLLNRPYDFLMEADFSKEIGAIASCGMTKEVLIFKKEGFVLKFSREIEDDTDFCMLECENYKSAKAAGLERILLPTTFFYKNDFGITFYKQPIYYKTQEDLTRLEKENLSHKMVNLKNKSLKNNSRFDELWDRFFDPPDDFWIIRAIQYYGYNFMEKFADWTCENSVNDLHEANIGYVGNFRPVVFDYSGF